MPLHTCILNPSNHLKPSARGKCTTVHNTVEDTAASFPSPVSPETSTDVYRHPPTIFALSLRRHLPDHLQPSELLHTAAILSICEGGV